MVSRVVKVLCWLSELAKTVVNMLFRRVQARVLRLYAVTELLGRMQKLFGHC